MGHWDEMVAIVMKFYRSRKLKKFPAVTVSEATSSHRAIVRRRDWMLIGIGCWAGRQDPCRLMPRTSVEVGGNSVGGHQGRGSM